MLFVRQFIEDRRGGAGDMSMMGKTIAALADIDGSQLSGPFVQVAEKVAVDRSQMRKIKMALKRRLGKLVGT